MATELRTERYGEQSNGVLSCYERRLMNGPVQPLGYSFPEKFCTPFSSARMGQNFSG